MKIPLRDNLGRRRWTVDQSSDQGLQILATKNIDFDKRGYATLAARTISIYNNSDDADFDLPMGSYYSGGLKRIATSDDVFIAAINDSTPSLTQDTGTDVPTGMGFDSSACIFNGEWAVTENADLTTFDGSTYTDRSVTLTSGVRHPVCEMKSNRTLLIGNGAQVKQFNTSYTEGTNLSLPAGLEVVAIAYNRNQAAIVTWDDQNEEAWFFIWDGATAAANYSFPMGSNRGYMVLPFEDGFVIFTGAGKWLQYVSGGLKEIAGLPSSFTTAVLGDEDDLADIAFDTSAIVDNGKMLFNLTAVVSSKNSEPNDYFPTQPSGVYCIDPEIGAYHRHALSGAKLVVDVIPTADVNTTDDQITVTAAPETGTEVVYNATGSTVLGGLEDTGTYFVIKVDATTIKLASSRTNALAGTAINLTGTGNNNQVLWFLIASDFGQLYVSNPAGLIARTGPSDTQSIFNQYILGGRVPIVSATTDVYMLDVVSKYGENRGWILTQWVQGDSLNDLWEKICVKARGLVDDLDKIVVKYRLAPNANLPIIGVSNVATWVDANTFTTTEDLSAVKTAFDASDVDGAYEVEFIAGAGSGYTAHITGISEAGGTYTVNIDEDIKNIAASDTAFFVIENFLKLKTIEDESAMSSSSNPNYSEFPIGKDWKEIQFKIELRGRGGRVQLQELDIVNTPIA